MNAPYPLQSYKCALWKFSLVISVYLIAHRQTLALTMAKNRTGHFTSIKDLGQQERFLALVLLSDLDPGRI